MISEASDLKVESCLADRLQDQRLWSSGLCEQQPGELPAAVWGRRNRQVLPKRFFWGCCLLGLSTGPPKTTLWNLWWKCFVTFCFFRWVFVVVYSRSNWRLRDLAVLSFESFGLVCNNSGGSSSLKMQKKKGSCCFFLFIEEMSNSYI